MIKKRKDKVQKKKSKVVKKIRPPEIKPMFPKIIIERVCKNNMSRGGIIVTRLQMEETEYAYVFEAGENPDYSTGNIVLVHPHCGHDFVWNAAGDNPLNLTIIEPEDIIAKVEGTPKEKRDFIDRARGTV